MRIPLRKLRAKEKQTQVARSAKLYATYATQKFQKHR